MAVEIDFELRGQQIGDRDGISRRGEWCDCLRGIVDPKAPVAVIAWFPADFQGAPGDIDDPVLGDSRLGVQQCLCISYI